MNGKVILSHRENSFNLLIHSSSSSMTLQSNAGLRLYNGPPPSNLPWPHFWFPDRQFFTGWGCQPHAQPPAWRTRSHIYNPWDWMAQLYPQALGTHFSRLLRASLGYSLIPVTTRDTHLILSRNLRRCGERLFKAYSGSKIFNEPENLDLWLDVPFGGLFSPISAEF